MKELTKEQLDKRQLANECMEESIQKLLEGNLRAAEEITVRARDIFEEIQDKHNLAMALNRLSIIYGEMGNDSLDLECLLDAIEIADGSDDYILEAKLHNNLGSRYMEIGADNRALECFRAAAESYEKACKKEPELIEKNYSFTLILNLNFSTIYCKQGDLEHSRRHLEMARTVTTKPIDSDLNLVFMCFEGLTLWKLGDREEAKSLVGNIVKVAEETDYTTDYLEVMTDLLELLKAMKDFENWDRVLKIMEGKLTDEASVFTRIETLKRRIDYYKEHGDTEKLNEACVEYFELSCEKAKEENVKKASMIELQLEMRRAAKQKKQSDKIAYTDTLTGVGNRNRLLDDSKVYIADSIMNEYPLAVGLIDIDFFKECNDTYGHLAGDKCLKDVADIIVQAVGKKGKVYRYGGDEFLILIPELVDDKIMEICADIKERLEAAQMPNEKSAISKYVTVSQGFAEAMAEKGDTIESLINLADRVLYSVKRKGRNGYQVMDYVEILKEL